MKGCLPDPTENGSGWEQAQRSVDRSQVWGRKRDNNKKHFISKTPGSLYIRKTDPHNSKGTFAFDQSNQSFSWRTRKGPWGSLDLDPTLRTTTAQHLYGSDYNQ